MYRIFSFLLLNLIILLISFKTFSSENKILFKINNQIITSVDLLNEINYLRSINEEFKNIEKNKIYEIAKQSLIREKIKEIELVKILKEVKIENEILDDLLISYFNKFGINSKNDLNNYFHDKNINPKLVENKITIEALWNQLIYSKFNQSVKINEEEIKEELKQKSKQKIFQLSEIFFSLQNDENINEKFKLINKEIKEKGFSQAALSYSISESSNNGGKIGWVKESVLSKQIKNQLDLTMIGNFTNPLVVPGGFLILKVENIKQVENEINVEKEIKAIIKQKRNKQLNQFSNVYFNKIKKNIQINEL